MEFLITDLKHPASLKDDIRLSVLQLELTLQSESCVKVYSTVDSDVLFTKAFLVSDS